MATQSKPLSDRVKTAAQEREKLLREINDEIRELEDRLKVLRAQRAELGATNTIQVREVIVERCYNPFYPYTIYCGNASGYQGNAGGAVFSNSSNAQDLSGLLPQ
jgi:ribosomal protein L29